MYLSVVTPWFIILVVLLPTVCLIEYLLSKRAMRVQRLGFDVAGGPQVICRNCVNA